MIKKHDNYLEKHRNRRFPKGIAVASVGFDKAWQSKVERLSLRYTTDWRELLRVRCG